MTTAHLANAARRPLLRARAAARRARARGSPPRATRAAIDRIEAIVAAGTHRLRFRARSTATCFSPKATSAKCSSSELEAAHRAGLRAVRLLRARAARLLRHRPLPALSRPGAVPSAQVPRRAWRMPSSARAAASSPARTPTHDRGRRAGARSHVGRHVVTAGAVVVATNAPVNDRVAIHTKQAPYMTYVIGARVPRGCGAAGRCLGHRRSVPLPCARRSRRRSADRRRRGPQDRPGGRHGRALRAARELGARALPDDGRGRVPLVRAGDGDRWTASRSSAATRWTTTTSTSPPATRAWA